MREGGGWSVKTRCGNLGHTTRVGTPYGPRLFFLVWPGNGTGIFFLYLLFLPRLMYPTRFVYVLFTLGDRNRRPEGAPCLSSPCVCVLGFLASGVCAFATFGRSSFLLNAAIYTITVRYVIRQRAKNLLHDVCMYLYIV